MIFLSFIWFISERL